MSNDLGFKLLRLESKTPKNVMLSPLSVRYALSMLADATAGETHEQIASTLGETPLPKYGNLDNVIAFANAFYIRNTFATRIKQSYQDRLIGSYDAEIVLDDFANATNVNGWIEGKTMGQIKNTLSDDAVSNPLNKAMLINALAIDMAWRDPFEESGTHGQDFYMSDGSKMTATTMYQKTYGDAVSYYQDDRLTALSMVLQPYDSTSMEFVAIMPNGNLADYIQDFSSTEFDDITSKMTPASTYQGDLIINVPKFSFDFSTNLVNDLTTLGIDRVFSDGADFTPMITPASDGQPFGVSDVIHKTHIDFGEKGVRAAAVTVIMTREGAVMAKEVVPPMIIDLDRPFMYVIRDRRNGEIWFVGTMYEPNAWENDEGVYRDAYRAGLHY